MADICVVGAGPAGSTFAARMAQLGHDVYLIERERFPRSRLGESLSPGVLPLLEVTGAREAVDAAGFRPVRSVLVQWDEPPTERHDPRERGLLVDRSRFDALMLEHARALGVRVLQPASIRARRLRDGKWNLDIAAQSGSVRLSADFVAEATGRSAGITGHRRRTGCRTLALYGYWRGRRLPERPRIEAGADAWYWGVPLPDGTYNTLAFVDVKHYRAVRGVPLAARFHELLGASALMAECDNVTLEGPVRAIDATSYLDDKPVSPDGIKIGDAALAIDPISSSGVQKAIQSALAGAIVCNTILRQPAASTAAFAFYQHSLAEASTRHGRWAADHYGSVARRTGGSFWQDRASAVGSRATLRSPRATDPGALAAAPVKLSRDLAFVEVPCIEGDFVAVKPALEHPALEAPVAYLGGWELVPLLRQLPAGLTPVQIAQVWSSRMPIRSALSITGWLLTNGILVGTNRPSTVG